MNKINPNIKKFLIHFLLVLIAIDFTFGLSPEIRINNLGVTGIEKSNQEYTSQPFVMLILTYDQSTALKCRYINSQTIPSNSSTDWSFWEVCLSNKLWKLPSGPGKKMVYYQVNYSTALNIANDSIFFNYTGSGLDTTAPKKAVIRIPESFDEDNIITGWFNASDDESTLLGIPLRYHYKLWNTAGTIIDSELTSNTSASSNISSIDHNTTLFINVTAINSANLRATSKANFTVDKEPPHLIPYGTYLNLSNNGYIIINDEDLWVSSNNVNLSWISYDNVSGIRSFSYILSKDPFAFVDDVPEGDISDFAASPSKRFSELSSGKYYFKVKPKDKAGNWGNIRSINFSIDSTKPTKPKNIEKEKNDGGLRYKWEASTDPDSDIQIYLLNLSYLDGTNYKINYTTGLSFTYPNLSSGEYALDVCSVNYAGLKTCSNEEVSADFTPPIMIVLPNVTGISKNPILKVWTDETAVCSYNSTFFKYTNTTYHESRLELDDDVFGYVIACTDSYGNTETKLITLTIDSSMSPDAFSFSDIESYENIIDDFAVDIMDSGNPVFGIAKNEFQLLINGKEYDISVFDMGNGRYNISYVTPKTGTYDLSLSISQLNNNFTLISKSLKISGIYEEPSLSPTNLKHISFHNSNTRIGIATDSETNLIGLEKEGIINISDTDIDKNIFIINTKKSQSFIGSEKYMESGFFERMNPTFSYILSDTYFISLFLDPEYDIKSDSSDLRLGKYSYFLENRIARNGKKEVMMNQK